MTRTLQSVMDKSLHESLGVGGSREGRREGRREGGRTKDFLMSVLTLLCLERTLIC